MGILKAGTSLAEFDIEGEAGIWTSSSALSPYVVEAINLSATSQFINYAFASRSEIWLTFYISYLTESNSQPRVIFRSGGVDFLRLARISSNTVVEYWDGSGWVQLGAGITYGNGLSRLDMRVKLHATDGAVSIWRDKAAVFTFEGNTLFNSVETFDLVAMTVWQANGTRYSGMIFADEDTRPLAYAQLLPTGAGEVSEWNGSATNVLGVGFDDGTIMSSNEPDNRQLFAMPSLPATFNSGWDVVGLFATARAATEPGKESDLRFMARANSVDGFTAPQPLAEVTGLVRSSFLIDPDTSAAWTVAGVNGAEIGVQSRIPA